MSTPDKAVTTWVETPPKTGASWLFANLRGLCRRTYVHLLSSFVSLLGTLSTPGMKPACRLQVWALRRMGVTCASSEVWIGSRVSFDYPHRLVLGRRVTIGPDSRITARSQVTIGDDFLAAPGLIINTGSHDAVTLVPQSSPITLGQGVWCGTRVTICAGVSIGDGAVLGAGSVVLKDIPAWHLAVGVPCKPQRALSERPAESRWSNFRTHTEE